MVLPQPVLCHLTYWPPYSEGEECDEVYGIGAPPKDGLVWSILLSTLIQAAKTENFSLRLSLVTGGEQEASKIMKKMGKMRTLDEEVIRKRLQNVNPFKNAHTLYMDDNLIALLEIFKLRLNQIARNLFKDGNTYVDNLKLQAASDALQCHIDLFEELQQNMNFRIFCPKKNQNASDIPRITIFRHCGSHLNHFVYGFATPTDNSLYFRKNALRHILRIANVDQNLIPDILNLVDEKEFLIKLLLSPSIDAVITIYQSSYVLQKMIDIGLDINPLSVDENNLSAFYHCLILDRTDLLFILYGHVVNFIPSGEESTERDETLTSLRKIHNTMKNDYQVRREFPGLVGRNYDQIMRFNEYQCEIMENITRVNLEKDRNKDKVIEIVKFILDKYIEYYYFDKQNKSNPKSQLDDYVTYHNYHEQLDNYTYLLFFDHFLSLKNCIKTSKKHIFISTLKYLFRYLICKSVFCKRENSSNHKNSSILDAVLFVPFKYRLKLKESFTATLCELRQAGGVNSDEEFTDPRKIVIESLKDDPLIKEESLISRLKLYLKTAVEVPMDSKSQKPRLALERALQVAGETLYRAQSDGCVTPLLKHSLPKELVKELLDIRNNVLSHYHAISTHGRQMIEEENQKFWEDLQSELKQVLDIFECVFALQELRVEKDMIDEFIEESASYSKSLHQKLSEIQTSVYLKRKHFYKKYENRYIFLALDIIQTFDDTMNDVLQNFQNQSNCLKYLLDLISEYCDSRNSVTIKSSLRELQTIIDTNGNDSSQGIDAHILIIFSDLKINLNSMLMTINSQRYEENFTKLMMFYNDIKLHDFFTTEEKRSIKKEFADYLEQSAMARRRLIEHFEGMQADEKKTTLTSSEIEEFLAISLVSGKQKTKIAKSNNPKEIINILTDINDDVLKSLDNEFDNFYQNFLKLLGDFKIRKIIPYLPLPMHLHKKIRDLSNKKLNFVIQSIELMRKILTVEDSRVLKYKRCGTNFKCKDYTKQLMRQRYIEDMDTRAALETLLLDVLELIHKNKIFKELSQKTSSHFEGLDLRNFLSHGCPIFETTNDQLDAENLAKEIIDTVLKLIDDLKAIEALVSLWKSRKYSQNVDLKKFVSDIKYVSTDQDTKKLKNIILKCERWEDYVTLLPIK